MFYKLSCIQEGQASELEEDFYEREQIMVNNLRDKQDSKTIGIQCYWCPDMRTNSKAIFLWGSRQIALKFCVFASIFVYLPQYFWISEIFIKKEACNRSSDVG